MGNAPSWSIEEYCAQQVTEDWSSLAPSSQDFFRTLALPSLHPFCRDHAADFASYYLPNIPRQGPLQSQDHLESVWDILATVGSMVTPPLAAMGELWLRLFASLIAPLGMAFLLHKEVFNKTGESPSFGERHLSTICLLTVASSVVLLTDTLYVLEFGPHMGASFLFLTAILSWRACQRHGLARTRWGLLLLISLAAYLIYDTKSGSLTFGHPDEKAEIDEGLYYDSSNALVNQVVENWPLVHRTYSYSNNATPWMRTGDSRTGLLFLLNQVGAPTFHRVWAPVSDGEVLALDISFPPTGHDPSQPLFLVLHGLNGGSQEEYVRDFTLRRTHQDNSTVVVMVARGLMDTPVRGWNIFHGARWTDAHEISLLLRKALGPKQILAGVGYSMGAIILSNWVVNAGSDCVLDAAVAISGALDTRFQEYFVRAQRLWQPMLTKELRQTFLLGKWGERVRARLSKDVMKAMMRATHITNIDETAVVHYNGFRDVDHYYSTMSALGDVPMEEYETEIAPHRQIHQLAIPFCVIHALDDPLVTWRTVAHNKGAMHPANLAKTGKGNLLLLLTHKGGHVGWPLGMLPYLQNWSWMNDAAATFAQSVQRTKYNN